VSVEVVCGLSTCNAPLAEGSREVLCDRHLARIDRPPPGVLVKHWEGELSEEELAEVSQRVERDAWPLFLVAMSWCMHQAREAEEEER
jgi:hypothetical protein